MDRRIGDIVNIGVGAGCDGIVGNPGTVRVETLGADEAGADIEVFIDNHEAAIRRGCYLVISFRGVVGVGGAAIVDGVENERIADRSTVHLEQLADEIGIHETVVIVEIVLPRNEDAAIAQFGNSGLRLAAGLVGRIIDDNFGEPVYGGGGHRQFPLGSRKECPLAP